MASILVASESHRAKLEGARASIQMPDPAIRVLTLNCWGLKYVSKQRETRLQAIAAELGRRTYDLIALQEIWVFADYERVRDSVSERLPFSKYFYSGALGAGLAIFSRFPIISSSIHPYSLNGAPLDVIAGDWFVGKAAASVVIAHPVLGQVEVFNTHFFAKGGEGGPEHNRAHRLVNSWEFAKLARQSAELGRYVIAAGDFNSTPPALSITILREQASLTDAWTVVNSTHSTSSTIPPPQEAISVYGITADSPLNTFTAGKSLDENARRYWGKRLDYVFYRQPKRASPAPQLKCTECKVVFTEKIPGHDISYSDHFGFEATLSIQEPADVTPVPDSLKELSEASIASIIQALAACYRFSRHRARRELLVFAGSIILLLGLIVGSSWLPRAWINPIFILVTIFFAWLATTMLYEGFIYGNWECNALMNVIEELEIHKKTFETRTRLSTS